MGTAKDMSNLSLSNEAFLALDQKSIDGVDKYFAKVAAIPIAGAPKTPADIKADFQADIDASKAVDAARADLKAKLATKKAARATARATRKGLKAYMQGNYGGTALLQMLEDLGYPPPKGPGKKTVAVKAAAVAQAKATRELRHTMGSRQRQAIKAAPVQAAEVPVAPAPAAPATPASPAVPALPAGSKPTG